jgi:hypothetical protein
MKWPPYLLKLWFRNGRHSFGPIWLPLFILGPVFLIILLALCLIALPFVLLSFLFTWRWTWWRTVLLSVPAFVRILCALPGIRVDVGDKNERFVVAFY